MVDRKENFNKKKKNSKELKWIEKSKKKRRHVKVNLDSKELRTKSKPNLKQVL